MRLGRRGLLHHLSWRRYFISRRTMKRSTAKILAAMPASASAGTKCRSSVKRFFIPICVRYIGSNSTGPGKPSSQIWEPIVMKLRAILILGYSLAAMHVLAAPLSESDCKESDGSFSEHCNERMKQLSENIKLYVKDISCSHSNECKTVGYGSKFCGGPALYLAYSRKSDSDRFLEQVLEYNQLSRIWAGYISRKRGIGSDCAVVSDPGAVCVNNRCVLRRPTKIR